MAPFEPLKLLEYDFNADPDPAFYCNAGPEPVVHSNVDLDPASKIMQIRIRNPACRY